MIDKIESEILIRMINYNSCDIRRINHALKVFSFAKAIAGLENLKGDDMDALMAASILHDIGIKESEKKYNSSAGKYQEIEGPPVAKKLMEGLNLPGILIERICYLIGNHHSYNKIDGMDFQILVESDSIVNISEENLGKEEISSIEKKYFRTSAGKSILNNMFS